MDYSNSYRQESEGPKYTRVDVEGHRGYYASLTRQPGTNWINVDLLTPEVEVNTAVPADNRAEQRLGAERLHEELEGFVGDSSQVRRYLRALYLLADRGRY